MLYLTFMGCLSACSFEWDAGDLALLHQMTREQLRQEGVPALTDLLVDRSSASTDLLVDRSSASTAAGGRGGGGHHQPY